MVGKHSNTYLQWALRELSAWRQPTILSNTKLLHIHGTNDKTLPFKLIKNPDLVIENGSHFMVYKQHQVITDWMVDVLLDR